MANGTDTDQYVILTKAKRGLKREFEFAVKSQSQISESTRRTRSGSDEAGGSGSADLSDSSEKRLNTEEVEVEVVRGGLMAEETGARRDDPASDDESWIVDPVSDDERKSNDVGGENLTKDGLAEKPAVGGVEELVQVGNQVEAKPILLYTRKKFKENVTETADIGLLNEENSNSKAEPREEKDESNKMKLNNVPKNLKDFLATGFFEGLPVKYQRSIRARVPGEEAGIRGVIKGGMILCFCNKCKGTEVVSPHIFEKHAGSSNKRPPDYIFLENRKSLRDVMNACKNVAVDAIEETIQKATGSDSEPRPALSVSICDSRASSSEVIPSTRHHTVGFINRLEEKATSDKPLTRISSEGKASRYKIEGTITRKDLNLHKLVFNDDILPDGTEVAYYANSEKLRGGYKSGTGICCDCCNKVISPSQFEAHAGRGSHKKPFHNIYVSNGVTLHELAVSMLKRNVSSVKENDKLCKSCGESGDLITCGGCPRSFHQECAPLLSSLNEIWYCQSCESNLKGKFNNANALAAGRVPDVDPIEQIVNRSIRTVNIGEVEIGGCVLCRDKVFEQEFGPLTIIICEQCEREYHVGCLKDRGMADLKEEPKGQWFCCKECERTHSALHKLVTRGEERLPDPLLSVIKEKSKSLDDSGGNFDVKWRIISGKTASEEIRPLLITAVDILQENFGHIVDPVSNIDLIPAMLNGEDVKIQDFRGIHCAVLTVNSAVVSAIVFRIRGQELAEMPLVATSSKVHGQGYFQTLFACLERFLGFVKVQKIVLPAADGAESIWTTKFGFSRMSEEELKPCSDSYHLMNFHGLLWFKKAVPKVRVISRE